MYPHASPPLVFWGITLIATSLVVLFVVAHGVAWRRAGADPPLVRRRTVQAGLIAAAWCALFGFAAASGLLARFDLRPPPLALAMGVLFAGAFSFPWLPLASPLRRLPLAALIGFQAFRLPLELVMHEAARSGVMPSALSFSGYNFDILTGALAIPVALLAATGRAPRWLVLAWSALGIGCLVVIAVIAILTAPFIAALGPGQTNEWVAYLPFVFLPAVMVTIAIIGHAVVLQQVLAGLCPSPTSS